MIVSIIKLIQDKILRKRKNSGIFLCYLPIQESLWFMTFVDGKHDIYGGYRKIQFRADKNCCPIFLLE